MIQKIEIKMLRLNTGEDIIGECLIDEENSCVNIENPMRIALRRMSSVERTMISMTPWLPLEIIEDNFASINYADIITIIEPKASFSEYYCSMVEEFIERVELEKQLTEQDLQEDDDLDEEDQEAMKEILEALKESKKGKLH
jgi:C4-type Zn-finger protein